MKGSVGRALVALALSTGSRGYARAPQRNLIANAALPVANKKNQREISSLVAAGFAKITLFCDRHARRTGGRHTSKLLPHQLDNLDDRPL